MTVETTKVGKRGTVVLPAKMRRRLGLDEGATIVIEEDARGILLRPAEVRPVRIYTDEEKAEFLLNNAVSAADYAAARAAVREMGFDPDKVSHVKPDTRRGARRR
jgi:AbrB family looped-hinge helix DNA binding protein